MLFVQIMNKDALNLKTFEKKLYFTIFLRFYPFESQNTFLLQ